MRSSKYAEQSDGHVPLSVFAEAVEGGINSMMGVVTCEVVMGQIRLSGKLSFDQHDVPRASLITIRRDRAD